MAEASRAHGTEQSPVLLRSWGLWGLSAFYSLEFVVICIFILYV